MSAPALPPLAADATVAVVVPARDAAGSIGDALVAVLGQRPPVDEVAVGCDPGDSATRDAVLRAAAGDARVRLVDAPGGRTPDALRAAIDATSGEVVIRVDAHAVIPPGYVARVVETLRRTGAANVGGRQVPTADDGFAAAVAAAMASPAGAGGATYRSGGAEGPADTVYLGAFRRAALAAVGSYDARLTRNQDAELNLRLTRAGYVVWFDPELAVAYTPRGTVRALASQYHQYGRWRRVTARLHGGSLRPRQLAAPAVVFGLAGAAVASAVTQRPLVAAVPAAGYAAGLLAAGAHATRRPLPAVRVAVALGTMHLAWGVGFLAGPPRAAAPPSRPGEAS